MHVQIDCLHGTVFNATSWNIAKVRTVFNETICDSITLQDFDLFPNTWNTFLQQTVALIKLSARILVLKIVVNKKLSLLTSPVNTIVL